MKAGIFFTGTGPILLLTTYESLNDSKLIEKLAVKGVKKFIAYEISEEKVKEKYGLQFKTIMSDLRQTDIIFSVLFHSKNWENRYFLKLKTT